MSTPFTPILRSVLPDGDAGPAPLDENAETLSWARDSTGPVLAKTQYQSAWRTPDIQHFVPERIQSSPSGAGPGAHRP